MCVLCTCLKICFEINKTGRKFSQGGFLIFNHLKSDHYQQQEGQNRHIELAERFKLMKCPGHFYLDGVLIGEHGVGQRSNGDLNTRIPRTPPRTPKTPRTPRNLRTPRTPRTPRTLKYSRKRLWALRNLFSKGQKFHIRYSGNLATYRHAEPNWYWPKNMLLKNPQLLRNHYETWLKWATHEYLILTKFRNYSVKIVDLYK